MTAIGHNTAAYFLKPAELHRLTLGVPHWNITHSIVFVNFMQVLAAVFQHIWPKRFESKSRAERAKCGFAGWLPLRVQQQHNNVFVFFEFVHPACRVSGHAAKQ